MLGTNFPACTSIVKWFDPVNRVSSGFFTAPGEYVTTVDTNMVTVMLVAESLCWRRFSLCWRFSQCVKSVTNILNLSPTSQTCHQHIWSPTSVTNIDVVVIFLKFSLFSSLQLRISKNINYEYRKRATSMLVTDLGDQMCL